MNLLKFLTLYFILSSTAVYADCLQTLTQNFQVDGSTLVVNIDDLDRDYGNDKIGEAIAVIKHAILAKGCSRKEINFAQGSWGKAKSLCQLLVPGKESSRLCYVETNLGYFTVSWDLLTGAYVTFHRWD